MKNIHLKCEQCDTVLATKVLYEDHRRNQHNVPVAIDTDEEEDGLQNENSKLKKEKPVFDK